MRRDVCLFVWERGDWPEIRGFVCLAFNFVIGSANFSAILLLLVTKEYVIAELQLILSRLSCTHRHQDSLILYQSPFQ